jgi:predicted DsbA family dithiol-disulfide isomerase
MSLLIKVFSDYVCPYCFLAEQPLEEATAGKDVRVEWMPFELRPEPTPTLRPEDDYLQKAWTESVYPLAKEMGVKIVLPRVSPQPHSRLAFEGYQYAKERGQANQYNHRIFRAFFLEERDIGRIDVLVRLAAELGLDAADFREAIETGRYEHAHRDALRHAYEEARITVVPTVVIGKRTLQGMPDRDILDALIDLELERRRRM